MTARVLHLASGQKGGALGAVVQLHRALLERGFESEIALGRNASISGTNVRLLDRQNRWDRTKLLINKVLCRCLSRREYHFRNECLDFPMVHRFDRSKAPDVIIAHVLSDFMSPRRLAMLSEHLGAPVIVMALDMGPFTGGCHYSWRCEKYASDCSPCPALRYPLSATFAGRALREKKKYFACVAAVVAPTGILAEQVRRASVFSRAKIYNIPLEVDQRIFSPVPVDIARATIGLPQDQFVVFCGAQNPSDRRKGFAELKTALRHLDEKLRQTHESITVAIAGACNALGAAFTNVRVIALGSLQYDKLAVAYRASDLFVCPSLEDSGPMMVNEAMSCGTPVVAFDIGVVRDLVTTGVNGWRVPLGDSRRLSDAIYECVNSPREMRTAMRIAARRAYDELIPLGSQVTRIAEAISDVRTSFPWVPSPGQ